MFFKGMPLRGAPLQGAGARPFGARWAGFPGNIGKVHKKKCPRKLYFIFLEKYFVQGVFGTLNRARKLILFLLSRFLLELREFLGPRCMLTT